MPYEECKNDHFRLAKEVLTELPGQLTDFFLTRGITPRAAKEDQRKALENKLSLRSKINADAVIDAFRQTQKQTLIDQATAMGLDTFQVQDIIEEKGIWQNDMNILMEAVNRGQGYFNPLKIQ